MAKLESETLKLSAHEHAMLMSPDNQVSVTDPDSRSLPSSGRGSCMVGYNVRVVVETEHYLIITHNVTNTGSNRGMRNAARTVLRADKLVSFLIGEFR